MIYLNATGAALSTSVSPTRWYSSTLPGAVVTGTTGADWLSASAPNAFLNGGAGDDTYAIWDSRITITEAAGGGIDTVQSWAGMTKLGANIENLQLRQGDQLGIGNSLNNILTGSAGADTLNGGAGNDVLIGGTGADAFIISGGNGSDVIVDFERGVDTIRLQDYALFNFAAVKAAMVQTGLDTTIALGGGERLVLRNTLASSLTARDFWLPADPLQLGMKQTFAEEFNSFSASASGIGTTWKTTYKVDEQVRTLSGNKEAEYYSDSSVGVNPFSLAGGVLEITAAPAANKPLGLAYTSGLITTAQSFAQLYGYFEARVDLPAGQGFWPAFWMLPADGSPVTEIDILEVLGDNTTTAYAMLHSTVSGNSGTKISYLPDLSAGFHTYGLSWQADVIRWYIDGNEVAEMATPADMNKPMYMLLNLAVGDTGSWPGKYAASMPTVHMQIDYVRAWQYDRGTMVISPAEVAAFGGKYTLAADGVSDTYDFSQSKAAVSMDAFGLSTAGVHTIKGSPLGDVVRGGPGNVNFAGSTGDDTFIFGSGLSRAAGGDGNDTFVVTKGNLLAGSAIMDFHLNLPGDPEHDTLQLSGFSAAARLEFVSTTVSASGTNALQAYRVVDGDYISPNLLIQTTNGTGRLGSLDVNFNNYGISLVTGPGDVAAFGGKYTLSADGVSDTYDFSASKVALTLDASGLSTAGTHTVKGSPLGSLVRGGPGTVNFTGGSGEDTFIFGSGLSRVAGGGGDDTFIVFKGGLLAGDAIMDFRLSLPAGGEHDTLQLSGFSAAARLDFVSSSVTAAGTMQSYRVVDGDYVSPNLLIQVIGSSARLGSLDYHFG